MSDNEDDVDFTSQAIRALRSTDKRGTLDDDSEPQLLNTSFEIKRQKSTDKQKHQLNIA